MATLFAASIISGMNKIFSGFMPVDPFWDQAAYEADNERLRQAAAATVITTAPTRIVTAAAKKTTGDITEKTREIIFKVKEAEIITTITNINPEDDDDNNSSERKCTVCHETKDQDELETVACGHDYCEECLQDLFTSSLSNESLFPPRCCRQMIKVESHASFLTPELVAKYAQKKVEFETTDRTYCWSPRCSAFISAAYIHETTATCPSCELNTCSKCKAQNHQGECKLDIEIQPTLETATENGWTRCFACRRMVELESGCNHMTCLCGAQFCYVCGDKWKTCSCPQFSEGSLPAAEEEHDDETAAATGVPHGSRRALHVQIADVAARIRNRHECHHDRWARVEGEHLCERCYGMTEGVAFECETCHTQACGECSNHGH